MKLPLIAACLVAGSTWTIAFAGDAAVVNPKTAQKPYLTPRTQAPSLQAPQQQRPIGLPSLNPLAINGSDNCATADAIAGVGNFTYDNSIATTGAEGQTEALCLAYGSTAVVQDVWFAWTAPSTGNCTMQTCGTVMDTKIAAYPGSVCPTAGTALACNDDTCANFASLINFPVTSGATYMLQIGLYPFGATPGVGTLIMSISAPITNDDCSGATVVVGQGPHAFSNIGATTGPQQGLGCGAGSANEDVWYSWVATFTGQCQFTLCNGGVAYDSLIAAYAGSVCPAPGSALACNDDSCGLVSKCAFPVTTGSNYMLQIGAYAPGQSGSGSFELTPPPPPPPPCIDYDDGSTDNLLGWIAGGDMVWLSRFGNVGVPTTISSIDVMWGSALFPGFAGPNGQATNVFLWSDDASQDGLPGTVAALLVNIPTTVSAIDTDTYVNYPITPTTITGIFYAGTRASQLAGQYVAPMDQTVHTYIDCSWFFGINVPGQFANYANPGANVQPPVSFDAVLPSQVLVRVNCVTGPATYLCDPGSGPTQPCPCSNPPSGPGRGCNNSSATGGASITGAGNASVGASTVVFTTANEKPTALTILLQGTTVNTGGIVFGQGIRCAAGSLKRLYQHNAVGGSITAPSGTDLDIPTRSFNLGDPILSGQHRYYLAYYRDATVLGGCSAFSTFNDTNTADVLWGP
jgi:hypothetical protein